MKNAVLTPKTGLFWARCSSTSTHCRGPTPDLLSTNATSACRRSARARYRKRRPHDREAIAAALEPLTEAVVALERRVEQLQGELAKLRGELERAKAAPPLHSISERASA